MRIVFEGTDLTGKSTLAKEVAKQLNKPYRGKIVRVPSDKLLMAQKNDFNKHPSAVLDRCYWMSNLIYEPLTNHAPSIMSKAEKLGPMLRDDNTLYVLVIANEATLGARYKERGDELQTLSTIIEANRMYQRFIHARTPRHLIIFSTDKGTIEENVKQVLAQIEEYLEKMEGEKDATN